MKKTTKLWISIMAVAVVVIVAIGLMNNQKEIEDKPPILYAHYEYGVVPMNLGTYSWNSVIADSIPYTDMDYDNSISYNEGLRHRNVNIFFSTSNEPSDFKTDNVKDKDTFEVLEMKRYVNGEEEILSDFDGNMILVTLESDAIYLYEFKVQFGENYGYYSVKINNNV